MVLALPEHCCLSDGSEHLTIFINPWLKKKEKKEEGQQNHLCHPSLLMVLHPQFLLMTFCALASDSKSH